MTDHDLPLNDYDDLAAGTIESQSHALDQEGLRLLLDHERSHAARPQIIAMLEHRLESLQSGTAQPSGSGATAPAPETAPGQAAAPPVTEGPPVNPPSHGNPTNPAQPRG